MQLFVCEIQNAVTHNVLLFIGQEAITLSSTLCATASVGSIVNLYYAVVLNGGVYVKIMSKK